ncbi:hypothetical protein Hanom_Chr14g01276361 [Helianthus anomalus]
MLNSVYLISIYLTQFITSSKQSVHFFLSNPNTTGSSSFVQSSVIRKATFNSVNTSAASTTFPATKSSSTTLNSRLSFKTTSTKPNASFFSFNSPRFDLISSTVSLTCTSIGFRSDDKRLTRSET